MATPSHGADAPPGDDGPSLCGAGFITRAGVTLRIDAGQRHAAGDHAWRRLPERARSAHSVVVGVAARAVPRSNPRRRVDQGASAWRIRAGGRTEAAAARRLDHEHVAGLHRRRRTSRRSPRACRRRARPSCAPTAPGAPPATPNGAHAPVVGEHHRGHRLEEADAADARRRRRGARPAPPLPRRIANDSSRTGKRHSSTSGSVSRELVMCVCTALAPSKSGPGARAAGDRLVVLVARRCRR